MATGTGKTYTAFQIIWRLWKSGAKKRILYLADRNILIDQTMVNDFKPFKGAMAKLSPNQKGVERVDADTGQRFIENLDLAVNRTTKLVDKSYEIYLSLYQAVSGCEARLENDAVAKRTGLAAAAEVLRRIRSDYSSEDATREALASIREQVSYIFARIHSPSEYELGDFDGGSVLVTRDGNSLVAPTKSARDNVLPSRCPSFCPSIKAPRAHRRSCLLTIR